MAEDEQQTCGKGVAANAILPERMAALLEAMAVIYDNHIRSLSVDDPAGKQEIEAYERLMRDYRASANQVSALAGTMRSYRDLLAANHDMAVLMDAKSVDAMEALVAAQEELATLVGARAAEFRAMLEEMRRA
jgi:hypothetical protein